jgi:antitoxin PrlF
MNSEMKSMKARIAERGQVTIPKRLRERLGMKPGTVLEFSEEHGRLIAVKGATADPVSEVYGCLGRKIGTDAIMAQLRGGSDNRRRH